MRFEFRRTDHRSIGLLAVLFAVEAIAGVSALQDTRSPTFALTHATVIDGTVSATRMNQTVLVSDGRIVAVGPFGDVRVPPGTREVDATGRFIIPGLWDAHVHTRYQGIDHLRLLLANGITSALDMGGPGNNLPRSRTGENRSIRDSGQARACGPRVLSSTARVHRGHTPP